MRVLFVFKLVVVFVFLFTLFFGVVGGGDLNKVLMWWLAVG